MTDRIFVVTGANKGIGYGIVRSLLEKVSGAIIYATARNVELGQAAIQKVIEELGPNRRSEILFHQLDITNEDSCKTLYAHLKERHHGLDVLINNAGFAFKNDATESPEEQANYTIGINYYGTKLISSILQPLIRENGRVVNVCSQAGIMTGNYSDAWIQKLRNPASEKDIDEFVEAAARENNRKENGFCESAYRVSKAAEISYTLLQAKALAGRHIVVNACCPGYVDTDMTSHKGHLTIAEGADTPVFLAIDPEAPHGQFVYLRKITQWN